MAESHGRPMGDDILIADLIPGGCILSLRHRDVAIGVSSIGPSELLPPPVTVTLPTRSELPSPAALPNEGFAPRPIQVIPTMLTSGAVATTIPTSTTVSSSATLSHILSSLPANQAPLYTSIAIPGIQSVPMPPATLSPPAGPPLSTFTTIPEAYNPPVVTAPYSVPLGLRLDNDLLAAALLRQMGVMPTTPTSQRGNSDCAALKEFLNLRPLHFSEEGKPQEAFDWLFSMENIYETVEFTEDQRVRFAAHKFTGRALQWWSCTRDKLQRPYSWQVFREVLISKFCPKAFIDQRVAEFMNFRQGQLTVEEYHDKFLSLVRYTPEMCVSDYSKAKKFEAGLRADIRDRVRMHQLDRFDSVYEKALVAESCIQERQQHHQHLASKRKGRPGASKWQGKNNKSLGSVPKKSNTGRTGRMMDVSCDHCGKPHATTDCWYLKGACLRCGSTEHKIRECPLSQRQQPQ